MRTFSLPPPDHCQAQSTELHASRSLDGAGEQFGFGLLEEALFSTGLGKDAQARWGGVPFQCPCLGSCDLPTWQWFWISDAFIRQTSAVWVRTEMVLGVSTLGRLPQNPAFKTKVHQQAIWVLSTSISLLVKSKVTVSQGQLLGGDCNLLSSQVLQISFEDTNPILQGFYPYDLI